MQGLIVFGPLALKQQTFPVRSNARVTVSFSYTVAVNTPVKLKAGPYYTNVLGKQLVDSCVGSIDISLPVALQPTNKTATVDFTLVPKASGGIEDGTYGLRVWIEDTNAVADADGVLVVTGNPAGFDISSILPLMMVMMMMGVVMPMMEGTEE